MCGILGGINIPINRDLLALIKHRGPDREAIYSDRIGENEVCLAHTRLSVVDLSEAGNQPMVSACGNYALIFNGEIYNHQELRKTLDFMDFKGHSDTETLLHLLVEHGRDVLGKLNGIFAFAFLDKRKGELLVARDPFGVKPVYYYHTRDSLIFSSEIRPIQRIVKADVSAKELGLLLNLRYLPSPYTLYKDIYKIRPGHYCVFRLRENLIEVDMKPFLSKVSGYRDISFQESVDLYGEKLKEAVARQLMGDVDMGVLLSGGVDSAMIAGLATQRTGKTMKAFTVGFDSRYKVNETGLAAETAAYFGMEHHVVKMDVSNFFDTFAECAQIVEEPLATTSFIPMYYLSRLASEYVKVVLTGQGADEPLGGYRRYQGEILKSKYPDFLFHLMKRVVETIGSKNEALLRGTRSLTMNDDILRFMNVYSLFTPEEVRRMTGIDVQEEALDLIHYYYTLVTSSEQTSADKMMSVDLRMNLADDLLLYTDKITMNFSLECRVPMLDLELVNYVTSLPTAYKVRKGKTKIVHKAFADRFLPKSIINRPKFGFQSPTDIWFRDKADLVESILLQGKLRDYIAPEALSCVIAQHRKGYNREKQIFLLLSINEWLASLSIA